MIHVEERPNEIRKEYLVRLAAAYMKECAGYLDMPDIFYDDVSCDGHCLAEDLKEKSIADRVREKISDGHHIELDTAQLD